jgi:hypothetical protein
MSLVGERVQIDSAMSLRGALSGRAIPPHILRNQIVVPIEHVGFDSRLHHGQLVLHRNLKRDIQYIFDALRQRAFPIEKIIPISAYDWDDDASMASNNTSGFNYRTIVGTDRLSMHAFGRALDINPLLNPNISGSGVVTPQNARYEPERPGTITADGPVASLFKERGFVWGGDWKSLKDYQHFERAE